MLAAGQGFEPWAPSGATVFKTARFVRSRTPPCSVISLSAHTGTRTLNRCKSHYCGLQGVLAGTRSKSYATDWWLLGSRFTGVCVARHGVSARLISPPRAFNVSGALPATHVAAATLNKGESLAFALPHVKRMLLLLRAPSRSRTYNPRIKSPLLCQLSYRGFGGPLLSGVCFG